MKNIFYFCFFLLLHSPIYAQEIPYAPDPDPLVQKKLVDWQDMKFGFMMHWGVYSQWGIVESWSICSEDWITRKGPYAHSYVDYVKAYRDLHKTFNPEQFNPEKWADAAWDAGMKYVVFTTKHHDGFCMFDSKYTDYKITGSEVPFRNNDQANITQHLFDAFRKKGFKTGTYFSKPDWSHTDYWAPEWATHNRCNNYDIHKHPQRWKRFEDFTYNQIEELMSDYGPVDILWLDGGWIRPDSTITEEVISWGYGHPKWGQNIDMHRIVKMAREKQPGLIVVDRSVHGPYENYRTPEQRIPDKTLPYPWETCMTMADGWSYSFNPNYKSTHQLIHTLVDIVAKGGNFLLNVGPGPDGRIDEEAYTRLAEIGDWMDVNGEAIYNSRPLAPYKEGKVCLTQSKDGKTIYAHYLADEDEQQPPSKIWMSQLSLPKTATARLLGTNKKLDWEEVGNGFIIHIPEEIRKRSLPTQHVWVIKI